MTGCSFFVQLFQLVETIAQNHTLIGLMDIILMKICK